MRTEHRVRKMRQRPDATKSRASRRRTLDRKAQRRSKS